MRLRSIALAAQIMQLNWIW